MRCRCLLGPAVLVACLAAWAGATPPRDVFDRVRDGWADNGGVRIHYVTLGKPRAPLVVLLHGFSDFWYGWREQIAALSRRHRVAAIDLRGYNASDHPPGVEAYDLLVVASDVAAVIRALGEDEAVVVGHDWGGAVAWTFAMSFPAMTKRLVVLNTPHPRGLLRELRQNPQQLANSAYARTFQQEGAHLGFTPDGLASIMSTDPAIRARYVDAFRRSSIEAMLAYYKRNYPREPYADLPLPLVQCPVLLIHGLDDPFLLAAGLDRTWEWAARSVTLVTVPGAGHFVQTDAPDVVSGTIERWLDAELGRTRRGRHIAGQ